MFDKLANIFRIPDLRRRILFTLALLFVYRLGGHITTPGIDTDKLESFFTQGRIAVPSSGLSICSPAGSCAVSRFSPWASCPTSRHRSFCSC